MRRWNQSNAGVLAKSLDLTHLPTMEVGNPLFADYPPQKYVSATTVRSGFAATRLHERWHSTHA